MLLIPCPWCGPRAETEFTYGADATPERPADDAALDAWNDYVFTRDNPRGPFRELWLHSQGCRRWIALTRDTLTHAISGAESAQPTAPHAAPPATSTPVAAPRKRSQRA